MMFFVYLVAIMVHANQFNTYVSIAPLMLFLKYFVSMELITIKVDYRSSYFTDIWNLLDLLFIGLLSAYIAQYMFTDNKSDLLKQLAIVNLLSWIRGLS